MEELNLTKIKGYRVTGSIDEWKTQAMGIFKDYNLACIFAKDCGWYGSKGDVKDVEIYTDGDKLYTVDGPFQFKDVQEGMEKKLKSNILSKLTKEEIEFLKIK